VNKVSHHGVRSSTYDPQRQAAKVERRLRTAQAAQQGRFKKNVIGFERICFLPFLLFLEHLLNLFDFVALCYSTTKAHIEI